MKKPKKLNALQKAKALLESQRVRLTQLTTNLTTARERIVELEFKLSEARRRTLPVLYQHGVEMNFYPIGIHSVKVEHEPRVIRSWDGTETIVHGPVRMQVEIEASTAKMTKVG